MTNILDPLIQRIQGFQANLQSHPMRQYDAKLNGKGTSWNTSRRNRSSNGKLLNHVHEEKK